jgi:hypothetical protein
MIFAVPEKHLFLVVSETAVTQLHLRMPGLDLYCDIASYVIVGSQ